MAKIRFLDQVPIGVFATPTGTNNGTFSGSFTGSLFGTASWAINALTASFLSGSVANAISASYALTASFALNGGGGGSSNISGTQYFVPLFNSTSSLITSSIYQSGSFTSIRNNTTPYSPSNPDILFVDGDGVDTYNLISAHTNINNYAQLNVQNFNTGSGASSDIVATTNDGDETTGFIDMGINSSQYTSSNSVGSAGDAYLYSTGNNLYIGNATPNKEFILFNGGLDAANNARIHIHDQGTISINTDQYNAINPPSLAIAAPNTTTNTLVEGIGAVDSFFQLAISNANAGTQASTDIVAYNNLDPTNQDYGFIDVGINSSNFNDPTNFPGWTSGDGYLYTDALLLRIGSTATGSINFFLGDNPTSGSRFKIKNNNQHEITGSLNVSGSITAFSFTGSLLGTASYATQALSASFTTTASFVLNAVSSSYASSSTSASYALSASFAPSVSPFPFTGNALISGSLIVQGSGSTLFTISGSNGIILSITDSGSSNFLFSVSSGSTDILTISDTKVVNVSGSLIVTGSITGSLLGTASYATNALSSSFALTASYVLQAVSSSFASTASIATSASYALSASFAPSVSPFPYTGSAQITGSLGVTGSGTGEILGINHTTNSILRLSSPSNLLYNYAFGTRNTITVNNSTTVPYFAISSSWGPRSNSSFILVKTGSYTVGAPAFYFDAGAVNYSLPYLSLGNGGGQLLTLTATITDSGIGDYTSLSISPTITRTTVASGSTFGIAYIPTISAITGSHYGLIIAPSGTFNGIGLQTNINTKTNLPTATLQLRGTSGSVFLVENDQTGSIFNINNNGTGSYNGFLTTTGSLLGTASYATNALSASYFSGSISTAISASYAATASIATSASYALTASFALNALSASYFSGSVSNAVSSSYPVSVTGSSIVANLQDNPSINTENSIFIGNQAGDQSNPGGQNAIYIGERAGQFSNGDNFIAIGPQAGKDSGVLTYSIYIGYEAGKSASDAYNTIALGYLSGYGTGLNTDNSIFIGSSAGANSSNTVSSNFIGTNTGQYSLNADKSSFIGYNAGSFSTGSQSTICIGFDAGVSAKNSTYSTFLGPNAGTYSVNVDNSFFVGNSAGYEASGSQYSNFIGDSAGYQSTASIKSNFIGVYAGGYSINSLNSNFIGDYAGRESQNTQDSNFIGSFAGSNSSNSSNSNFIGVGAGELTVSASYSNFIGYSAGLESNSSHSLNIGYQAGKSSTNNNSIILGTNITLPSGIDSGLNIGSILFGRNLFFDDVTSEAFSGSLGNGRIGINVIEPQYALDVSGSGNFTNRLTVTGSIALGDSTAPAVYTSVKTTIDSGSTVIYNVLTSSYDSAFFDYSLKGSTGARAGNIMAIWSGSSVKYTDNSTSDIGSTADFVFGVILSGSNMVLTGSTSTNGWTLKTAIRTI